MRRRSRSPSLNEDNGHRQSNKIQLPRFGLGTFRLKSGKCTQAVEFALELGVTLIDSAESYKNASDIRKGIDHHHRNNTKIASQNLTIITKVSKESLSDKEGAAAGVAKAITQQRNDLLQQAQQDDIASSSSSVDIIALLHWPGCATSNPKSPQHKIARVEAWRALVDEQKKGRVKYVGVSNFSITQIRQLIEAPHFLPPPQLNQVECHPYCQQKELRRFCQEHGILVQAYTSLGRSVEGPRCLYGNWEPTLPKLVKDPLILQIVKDINNAIEVENNSGENKSRPASAIKKISPELLLLRWGIENDLYVVPKATSKAHIEENMRCWLDGEHLLWSRVITTAALGYDWVKKINEEIVIPSENGEDITYAYPKEKIPI